MPFSVLQKALAAWMPLILNHPFNKQLADGSLPFYIFNDFLRVDKHYLKAYAGTLSTLANRLQTTHPVHAEAFYHISNEARDTEIYLHQKYLKQIHPAGFFTSASSITHSSINTYVKHLHETTQTKPIPVAIAAVLPCFMIYRELGMHMPKHPEHRFYDWIKTYSSSGFLENTEKMIAIFNEHSEGAYKDQALESFIASVQYEINFWDSVYNVGGLRIAKSARF